MFPAEFDASWAQVNILAAIQSMSALTGVLERPLLTLIPVASKHELIDASNDTLEAKTTLFELKLVTQICLITAIDTKP